MRRMLLGLLTMGLFAGPSYAGSLVGSDDKVISPVSKRFSNLEEKEVPDFQRHLLPVMGRLGCNGRACHGSFQGQGGFRLSLFGYDFEMDHKALTEGDEPRVNVADVLESLILYKPTSEDDHEGGVRMAVGSWQYNMFRKWIEGGAKAPQEAHTFDRLEVIPAEIVFEKVGQTVPLKVIAHWADGTVEDVTCITRFRTNDDSIAEVDENGLVTAKGKGDSHIVSFYDNGIAATPTMIPVSDRVGPKYPKVQTPTKIDELVITKLKKLGIVPSDLAGDAEFLRRVSLDIAGTLPTVSEIETFLKDRSKDKRAKKIDELLETPAYAAWWSTKLCDIMGNNSRNVGNNQAFRGSYSRFWYDWMVKRLGENTPYDELIARIVTANSRLPGQSYKDYCEEMTSYVRRDDPADFSDREYMPFYWERRNARLPEEKALGFAHAFLGVSIQCAQCHKHPFDQWTQQDFKQFTAFFAKIQVNIADKKAQKTQQKMMKDLNLKGLKGGELRRRIPKLVEEGKIVPFTEVFANARIAYRGPREANRKAPKGRVITPKLLGVEEYDEDENADPRVDLMEWMRAKDNPYFARVFVNRVWASYFNVGIIDPPDDQNLANPPSNEALLDYLAKGFIEKGFDIKWVHRQIANSRTYQLTWKANWTNEMDERNFSHAVVRRLPAEVAIDAIKQATAAETPGAQQDPERRAIAAAATGYGGRGGNYALQLFGKPNRETTCDCERSNEPNLLQSIFLQNDNEMLTLIDRGGWLTQIAKTFGESLKNSKSSSSAKRRSSGQTAKDVARKVKYLQMQIDRKKKARKFEEAKAYEQKLASWKKQNKAVVISSNPKLLIREAYLRTLSRPPRYNEIARSERHLKESESMTEGMKDLLWALLNSKEFITNH